MNEMITQIVAAVGWTIAATIISQLVSISLMRWLGLPPKKLIHEIENVQNPAVGASFFIISLAVGLFIGIFTSDGFSPTTPDFLTGAGWIILALVLGFVLTWISFEIAHRMMGVENNETTYKYIRRELIDEQNSSLAFFLGGLAIVPFIAVIFQMI
jgi:F0F1-type ATP synthase assembly protein I